MSPDANNSVGLHREEQYSNIHITQPKSSNTLLEDVQTCTPVDSTPRGKPRKRVKEEYLLEGTGTFARIVRKTTEKTCKELETAKPKQESVSRLEECSKYLKGLPDHLKGMVNAGVLEQILQEFVTFKSFAASSRPNESDQRPIGSSRRIGTLSVEERREKVAQYLEKRKSRSWNRKIAYECRKKVAETRFRVHGRFVARDQALSYLGISEQEFNTRAAAGLSTFPAGNIKSPLPNNEMKGGEISERSLLKNRLNT
eukprot:TRINITY_DN25271_c0_g1_i2.p1 TRINITY_DN25271_c0_g1~~TRINITY_DN25271_c0_g1_i2.p1  ORF type:complete len:256 (-),score=28.11 TRINITY_DN25271_c0_g1_i2:6-773(-)